MTTKTYTAYKTAVQNNQTVLGYTRNVQSGLDDWFYRFGADNPKWKYNISHGISAVNSLNASKEVRNWRTVKKLSAVVVPITGPFKGMWREISCDLPIFGSSSLNLLPNYSGASLADAEARASASLFKRLRAEMYSISGPTFLGELREAIMMIRRPCEALQKSFGRYMVQGEKALKSIARSPPSTRFMRSGSGIWTPIGKNSNRGQEARKLISELYLEFSFGWVPLISDVKAGAVALARFGTDIRRSRVSAKGESEVVANDKYIVGVPTPSNVYYKYHLKEGHIIRVSYHVGLDASLNVPSGSTERLQELCGFSWQNFIPTVWELLPWSFLVDYFTNVQQVLDAYTTDISHTTWVSKSVYTSSYRKMEGISLDVGAMKEAFGTNYVSAGLQDGGSYESEVSNVIRTSGVITYPSLTFSLPNLPQQWGNMAALLASQGRMRTNSFL